MLHGTSRKGMQIDRNVKREIPEMTWEMRPEESYRTLQQVEARTSHITSPVNNDKASENSTLYLKKSFGSNQPLLTARETGWTIKHTSRSVHSLMNGQKRKKTCKSGIIERTSAGRFFGNITEKFHDYTALIQQHL